MARNPIHYKNFIKRNHPFPQLFLKSEKLIILG